MVEVIKVVFAMNSGFTDQGSVMVESQACWASVPKVAS